MYLPPVDATRVWETLQESPSAPCLLGILLVRVTDVVCDQLVQNLATAARGVRYRKLGEAMQVTTPRCSPTRQVLELMDGCIFWRTLPTDLVYLYAELPANTT